MRKTIAVFTVFLVVILLAASVNAYKPQSFVFKEMRGQKLSIAGTEYMLTAIEVEWGHVNFRITPTPETWTSEYVYFKVKLHETVKVDLNDDGLYDFSIRLNRVPKRRPEVTITELDTTQLTAVVGKTSSTDKPVEKVVEKNTFTTQESFALDLVKGDRLILTKDGSEYTLIITDLRSNYLDFRATPTNDIRLPLDFRTSLYKLKWIDLDGDRHNDALLQLKRVARQTATLEITPLGSSVISKFEGVPATVYSF